MFCLGTNAPPGARTAQALLLGAAEPPACGGRTLCAIKEWTLAKLCPWTLKHLHLLTCLREFSRSWCPGKSQAWCPARGFLQTLGDSSDQWEATHNLEKPFSSPADLPPYDGPSHPALGNRNQGLSVWPNPWRAAGSSELPTPNPGLVHSHSCVLLTQDFLFW